MIDIIFIVLVFFIFLIGFSNYEHFQSNTTPEDDLYQTNGLKALTSILDENIPKIFNNVKTMVSGLKGELEGKLNGIKNHIEDCVDCVKFCGTEPYWCNGCCDGAPYPCDWGCTGSTNGNCYAWGYRDTCRDRVGCWKTRDKCTAGLPKWNCSPSPSGFSVPSFPDGWTGVSAKSC